jgi:TetR/AcrR family transcriptional regulator
MLELKTRILDVATEEFAAHGFQGVRVEKIAERAACSPRMLYKYYGDKRELYVAVLERAYCSLRRRDLQIIQLVADPVAALSALVEWTFDYMSTHREFVLLTRNENLLEGKFISLSARLSKANSQLIRVLRHILRRGTRHGIFVAGIDPLQLYISIVALSVHHIANEHTLSKAFQCNLAHADWLRSRRRHVRQLILRGILTSPAVG